MGKIQGLSYHVLIVPKNLYGIMKMIKNKKILRIYARIGKNRYLGTDLGTEMKIIKKGGFYGYKN